MGKRPKYQVVEVNIANAKSADSTTDVPLLNPDKDFPWITGVHVEVITLPGGNSYVKTGLSDGTTGPVIDPVPARVGSGLLYIGDQAFDKKFTQILIKNDGRTIKCQVNNPLLTTDALGKVLFTFRLEETDERRPSMTN